MKSPSSLSETHFFRHPLQFDHLVHRLSPRLNDGSGQTVRIWSAGCADGAEPYTILLCLHPHRNRLNIRASDFDRQALARAELALYGEWHLRGCPAPVRQRYFAQAGESWRLDPALARHVHFFAQDLTEGPFPPHQDVIFCRNVLIYVNPESIGQVLTRLGQSLLAGGLLYLGFPEAALARDHPDLELLDSHLAVYRKREKVVAQIPPSAPTPGLWSGEREALCLLRQAAGFAQADQHQLARQTLRQSLYLDPTLAASHYQLGLLELSQGRAQDARLHWRNVISLASQASGDQRVPGWEQCNWSQLLCWTRQHLERLTHV